MAFKQPPRPSESFEVVGLEDPALDTVPAVLLDVYRTERRIEVLDAPDDAIGWAGLGAQDEKPTRCRCYPLRAAYMPLLGPTLDSADLWKIFAAHCDRIVDLLDDDGNAVDTSTWWEGEGERRRIKTEVLTDALIPYRLWSDVAMAIIHRGTSGVDTPFSLPQGMSATSRAARDHRSRARQILDYARSRGDANKKNSDS